MIKVSNLRCAYEDKVIFNSLDLEIKEGSLCAVLGPNGCGKSTLMKYLSGILSPQMGSIEIAQKPLRDYGAKELAKTLSMVMQQTYTDMGFAASEIVMMGRNPYQSWLQNESENDLKIVEESMRMTNTWHLRDSKPYEMSGGELQRVMIARALAQKTPVMLLDEPTSNLDIAHQMEIMQLLHDINSNEHKTILIVVHDMNLAYHYCNDLLLLKGGRVIYHGPMQQGLTPARIEEAFSVKADIYENNIFFKK